MRRALFPLPSTKARFDTDDTSAPSATTPQPSYFDLPPDTRMPNEIFGTFTTPSRHKPTFNSLNYLKALPASIGARFGEGTFHVVKMFSSRSLEPEMLDALYGAGNVAKVVEKVWFAYPQLAPVRSQDDFAPVRPDEGLYYVNAFERLISTMETEVRRAHVGCAPGVSRVRPSPLTLAGPWRRRPSRRSTSSRCCSRTSSATRRPRAGPSGTTAMPDCSCRVVPRSFVCDLQCRLFSLRSRSFMRLF